MDMRASFFLLIIVASHALLSAQTREEVRHEGSWTGPTFDRGYVVDWDKENLGGYTLYSPDGRLVYSILPDKLGTVNMHVHGFAADSDGTVAGIYEMLGGPQPLGRIILVNSLGQPGLSINTGVYIPTRICFADDHSIWTVGFEYQNDDFLVFRRFSRQGQQLGAFVPWSKIASGYNALTALQGMVGGGWTLRAAKDRIGTWSPSDYEATKWIEVDLSGNLIGQWEWKFDSGLWHSPVAFTSSNALYAQVFNFERPAGYAIFDRSTQSWQKVTGYPKGRLLGADADDLVFSEEDGGWTVLHHVPSSALHVTPRKSAP